MMEFKPTDRSAEAGGWLPNFRRALRHVRPHLRTLVLGLIAAVGVGVFYTGSLSAIIPSLKIIFADHEVLVDWLHRAEAERRLQISLPADVPDHPDGLQVLDLRSGSDNLGKLHAGDRIISVAGQTGSAYKITRLLATTPAEQASVVIAHENGQTSQIALVAKPYRAWWGWLRDLAARLPTVRTPKGRFITLIVAMSIVLAISLLGSLCRFANDGLIAVVVQRTLHDIRCNAADHVLRLPVSWHSSAPVGDTLGRFSNDLNRVETGLTTLFGKTVREPLKAVGVLILTIAIDYRILLIALIGLPVAGGLIRIFGGFVKRAQKRASKSWGVLLDHLDERLAGVRVVKAYNMEAAESARFADEGRRLMKAQTHIEVADAATKPSLELISMMAVTGFVLYGGYRVFFQDVDPHLLLGAVVCLAGMFDPVRKLGNVYNRVQAAEASSSRVFELIDLPVEQTADRDAGRPALPTLQESIAFENVSFAYAGGDAPVLREIDLRVRAGEVVAIVGPNGSGKTTLCALLLRFFEPTQGRVLIDDHDLADVALPSLRAQIGLVTQDAVIFSGTIRENIAYGDADADDAAVADAAKLAHLDEFIGGLSRTHEGRTTAGLDAAINAKQLSGGQKQRLALARAILRDPPILILDEATSQVDAESERKIQKALDDVIRDRTTFIIAHRFSTIRRAHRIVVLNEGRIVGVGAHDALIETCPVYQALYQTQFAHDV